MLEESHSWHCGCKAQFGFYPACQEPAPDDKRHQPEQHTKKLIWPEQAWHSAWIGSNVIEDRFAGKNVTSLVNADNQSQSQVSLLLKDSSYKRRTWLDLSLCREEARNAHVYQYHNKRRADD